MIPFTVLASVARHLAMVSSLFIIRAKLRYFFYIAKYFLINLNFLLLLVNYDGQFIRLV